MQAKPVSQRKQKTSVFRMSMFWEVIVPVVLVVLCVGLGTAGFHQYYQQKRAKSAPAAFCGPTVWEEVLLAAGLPLLQTTTTPAWGDEVPVSLEIARGLGLLFPPYAFFIILYTASRKPFQHLRVWFWGLWDRDRYAIIGGLGWRGSQLVRDLRTENFRVVVIEKDRDNPFAESVTSRGVVVFHGDATAAELLHKVRVRSAKLMFVTTDSDEMNWRIVKQAAKQVPAGDRSVCCYVQMEGHRKRELLAATTRDSGLRVHCFNMFETIARRLLARHPVCRFGPAPAGAPVRVVILGDTPIGRAILLQVLRIGHYRKGQARSITMVTKNAAQSRADFLREYPCLDPQAFAQDADTRRLCDEVFPPVEFVELPASDTELLADEFALFQGMTPGSLTSLFVCLDDGMISAAYVTSLKDKLQAVRRERGCQCQVCYYFNYPEDEAGQSEKPAPNHPIDELAIFPFGNFLEECTVDAIRGEGLDNVAREIAAHYTRLYADAPTRKKLDDMTEAERQAWFDADWDRVSEWEREANRQAADHLRVKLLCIGAPPQPADGDGEVGFDIADVENRLKDEASVKCLAEMEHRRWCADKLLTGWRSLAPTPENWNRWKENKKPFQKQKLHIDLVTFDQLFNKDEKLKDDSQIRGIPQFLRNAEKRRQRKSAP